MPCSTEDTVRVRYSWKPTGKYKEKILKLSCKFNPQKYSWLNTGHLWKKNQEKFSIQPPRVSRSMTFSLQVPIIANLVKTHESGSEKILRVDLKQHFFLWLPIDFVDEASGRGSIPNSLWKLQGKPSSSLLGQLTSNLVNLHAGRLSTLIVWTSPLCS